MAKVRAYKLAEELGLEREDFMEKVSALGIDLRSAMAGVDDEQADLIRSKLGVKTKEEQVEKRTAGGTVIRRRRRKVVEEAPPPEPAAEPAAPPGPAVEEPAPLAAEAQPEVAAEPEAPEPEPQTVPEVPQPIAASAEAGASGPARTPAAPARRPVVSAPSRTPDTPAGRPAAKTRPVRRTHNEQVRLKEQEGLARTMLGNVQHRLEQRRMIVEQQARELRKRKAGGKRIALPPSAPRKKNVIRMGAEISFPELAGQTGLKVRDLLRRARGLGAEVDRDQTLDPDTVALLAEEINFEVQQTLRDVEEQVSAIEPADEDLEPRPPVVTVMGHVDHGKTSLLDTIRKANVVAGEAGGITQHIGAYKVSVGDNEVAFLDTPGHAAFTQMRARGAQTTDIVVLVVAANDGVMPQTVEAIDHARAAGVPIIVAINKIDLPEADPNRTKQALLEHELVPEDFGGDVICIEVSATKGTNVDKLLEMLALQAEVLELKARAKGAARGVVVEAELDKGRGPVATILVQEGTLKRGDAFVVGTVSGRVRSLTNEHGQELKSATPSTPVQIVGLSGVPEAGQDFVVVKNEREAKTVAEHRASEERRSASAEATGPSMEDVFGGLGETEARQLALVIKADVRGTMEAIRESAEKLSTERVEVDVILTGVGGITESDVMLALASHAVVYGFHVRPDAAARKVAEQEGVELRVFDIVYELLDDLTQAMSGLLPPKVVETVTGHAEVRQLFTVPRRGTVAGCQVADGTIQRSNHIRVIRDGRLIYTSAIDSLRHFKDDVREIRQGQECGIKVANFDDCKVGDVLEAFEVEERPDTL